MQTLMEHFELLLTLAVIVCFIFYLIDCKSYRKERSRLVKAFKKQKETDEERNLYAMRLMQAGDRGIKKRQRALYAGVQSKLNNRQPLSGKELYWAVRPVYPKEKFIEFFSGMFWILFIIWLLRSFFWEPFQIPSASMEPTLQNGDFILTGKYSYGIRLPVTHHKILPTGEVRRGDVAVFRYPPEPRLNYIKRIVALPGDSVAFMNGQIAVNGRAADLQYTGTTRFGHDKGGERYDVYTESLEGSEHLVQLHHDPRRRMNADLMAHGRHPFRFQDGEAFVVPEGHYFVMGDNRDDSLDGRVFGFVPDKNLVGKALFIWMNSSCIMGKGHCARIGKAIR